MRLVLKPFVVLFVLFFSQLAVAEIYRFSYTFDASSRGTPGHVLSGLIDGTLLEDNDTIVVNKLLSASLGGFAYELATNVGIRADDPQGEPRMSLSGNKLDFWVCVQGFTDPGGDGGGDCPFGNEGGFLVSDVTDVGAETPGWAIAGIPAIEEIVDGNNRYRDVDIPINTANWSVEVVALASPPRLVNIATRGYVGIGDEVLIGGFVIGGDQPVTVVVRAKGPSLAALGVPGTLEDPQLTLFSGADVIEQNDSYALSLRAADIPTDLVPGDAREAVIVRSLQPGAYTAIVDGVGGGTGVGIVEVFELR